jgi:hypothetical protein
MTEEALSAITSDKVETDNRTFATVQADQTCEEPLVPRENAFRQLDWRVTVEKGAIYKPQERVGIYAQEVDCKYGVQVDGDVFGRGEVSLEYGGASHAAVADEGEDPPKIGTRILGSVVSEGSVEVVGPEARMDDWTERPVVVYGDMLAEHVQIQRPTVVYGNVVAEQRLLADAPLVVVGEARSGGSLEASDLCAVSISARNDVVLGSSAVTVNPAVRSDEGSITLADDVGILDSETLARIQADHDLEAVSLGPWLFDEPLVWEGSRLTEADRSADGAGEKLSRAWRTVREPESEHRYIQHLFTQQVEAYRKDPPDVEQFRYVGTGSLRDVGASGGITVEHDGDGDVVLGTQDKTVRRDESTTVDRSVTNVDESTTVYDQRTTVEDSVLKDTDVGDETTEVAGGTDDGTGGADDEASEEGAMGEPTGGDEDTDETVWETKSSDSPDSGE